MGHPPPSDPKITKLLGELNELIAEAQKLREHIDNAAHQKPVWPERRQFPRPPASRKPHSQ